MKINTIMKLGLLKMNEIFMFILKNKVLSNSLSTADANETSLKELFSIKIDEQRLYFL